VHNFGTCVWRTAAQWQNPIFPASKHVFLQKSPLRCGSENASPKVVHRPRSRSSLHFDIRNMYQIRSQKQFPSTRRLLSATLLKRWSQVCRVKITFTELLTDRCVSTTKISMLYVVNWIPLRIRIRSRNTQPHLKGGPEPLEKEIHEILGSKREDRFSILLLNWYKIRVRFVFRTCFVAVIRVRARGHCESSRRSARR